MHNNKDSASVKELLRACENDYPAQTFCGFDSDGRPCVILYFDDAHGHCDCIWAIFSSMPAAFKAFLQVEEKLRVIDEYYAKKTDCPFWPLSAKK